MFLSRTDFNTHHRHQSIKMASQRQRQLRKKENGRITSLQLLTFGTGLFLAKADRCLRNTVLLTCTGLDSRGCDIPVGLGKAICCLTRTDVCTSPVSSRTSPLQAPPNISECGSALTRQQSVRKTSKHADSFLIDFSHKPDTVAYETRS